MYPMHKDTMHTAVARLLSGPLFSEGARWANGCFWSDWTHELIWAKIPALYFDSSQPLFSAVDYLIRFGVIKSSENHSPR